MTDEEYARFQRATDHLRPLAASGHFAGLDGLVAGAAALIMFSAVTYFTTPEIVSYSSALVAAYLVGRSAGNRKWRRHSEACETEIKAIRNGR